MHFFLGGGGGGVKEMYYVQVKGKGKTAKRNYSRT